MNKYDVLPMWNCLRCGHEWYPRRKDRPRQCPNPKCHSVWWDTPKTVKTTTGPAKAKA